MSEVPDSLADEDGAVVLNPSAIGNPDEEPRVWIGADLRGLFNPCACGGINGFHSDHCDEQRQRRARNCATCNGQDWIVRLGRYVRRRETSGMVCQTCGWDYARDGDPQ